MEHPFLILKSALEVFADLARKMDHYPPYPDTVDGYD
jgi:hypothetical protein